jgi:hypothetical protein
LLEAFAPNPDALEVHGIEVDAPPDVVYRTLWTVDFARLPVVAVLLGLRALPALLGRRRGRLASRRLTLHEIVEAGFGTLAEEPGREIVLGVSGRFWRLTGNLEPFDRQAFSQPVPAGMAQGVWSFRVLPRGERGSVLSTETRVTCGDAPSRSKFRRYWFVVRPFSGLIRILMLRTIRRTAEGSRPASRTHTGSSDG